MLLQQKNVTTVHHFMEANPRFFQQPIVKKFLEDETNVLLLQSVIENRNEIDNDILNSRFQVFFLKARLAKYIDKVCRWYILSFEKTNRIHQSQLILDRPVSNEDNAQVLLQNLPHPATLLREGDIREVVEAFADKRLYQAYHDLGDKTKTILNGVFIYELTTYEMAELLGCSQQNVSRLKSKGLKKLREAVTDE
ncbi:sigma-70 family RNA polymerase sigma factor [Salsuginibacillus kocurii]|uniref:sigma-70 family RNA polymerase sigma factor n=1 Tax=Salsuginibacillus kocurii TaxID=427078 RepID=UPI00037C5F89|nr:sigma-70 family RNA polymerase sigma factor [Salsuginibacillus kocurii]